MSNGDDGYCLVKGTETDYQIIDCVGDWHGQEYWDVCGDGSTKDSTLVRKSSVTSGNLGDWDGTTTAENCEWEVYSLKIHGIM